MRGTEAFDWSTGDMSGMGLEPAGGTPSPDVWPIPLPSASVRVGGIRTLQVMYAVVALSMGGNLLQNAMIDPAFDSRVKSVLTLGTPFHGSPLFTSNWMEYSMLRHYHSPISRLDTALAYRLYLRSPVDGRARSVPEGTRAGT